MVVDPVSTLHGAAFCGELEKLSSSKWFNHKTKPNGFQNQCKIQNNSDKLHQPNAAPARALGAGQV